jgi:hypothetical protein
MAFARPPDVQADQDSLGIRQIADDLEKSVRFSMFEYSTCRSRFSAAFFVLYGPPRFFPPSDSTL